MNSESIGDDRGGSGNNKSAMDKAIYEVSGFKVGTHIARNIDGVTTRLCKQRNLIG